MNPPYYEGINCWEFAFLYLGLSDMPAQDAFTANYFTRVNESNLKKGDMVVWKKPGKQDFELGILGDPSAIHFAIYTGITSSTGERFIISKSGRSGPFEITTIEKLQSGEFSSVWYNKPGNRLYHDALTGNRASIEHLNHPYHDYCSSRTSLTYYRKKEKPVIVNTLRHFFFIV